LQAEGDQALRRGELALAAEDYGRGREALSVIDRERSLAVEERSRAALDLQRAQREGDDIVWAAENCPTATAHSPVETHRRSRLCRGAR
jgi:hypothetical protein